jgi:small subunit ribosomal protein S20
VKSSTKTAVKKLTLAANAGQKDDLQALFIRAVSAIDKAAAKGVYHKNTASRKKSQLSKMANKAV